MAKAGNESTQLNREQESPGTSGDNRPVDRIFQDPTIAQTVSEDPLVRFFQESWRTLVTVAVIIVAVIYGRNVFQSTYETNMRRAADVFVRLQTEYRSLFSELEQAGQKIGGDTEEGVEAASENARKRQESVDLVLSLVRALEDEREPYRTLAKHYELLLRLKLNQYEQAKSLALEFGEVRNHLTIADVEQERLAAELSHLALARYEIDRQELREFGLARLETLIEHGAVTSLSAALAYSAVAEDPGKAALLLEGLLERQPEHTEILRSEIDRLVG